MKKIAAISRNKSIFLLLLTFLLSAANLRAQQAGMRGYTFDAERYKVDMEMRKMNNQRIQPYTPSEPKNRFSDAPVKTARPYKAPKYPSDTLVFFVDDFIVSHSSIYSPADSGTRSPYKPIRPVEDTVIMTGDLKYKNTGLYGLAYGWYNDDADLKKYIYHANKSTTCWVRKTKGSDKTFFRLGASIERNGPQDNYWFYINNKGEAKIVFTLNGAKEGTIFKTKTSAWIPDGLNELTALKIGEKLSFLCNGKEVHSITLEHPWTKMYADFAVEYGVEVTLYRYMHVFYPY